MVAVAIPTVSQGFPIIDASLAMIRRFLTGRPLFDGDKYHIREKLLKRGLSQRDAVLTLYAVTAGFGFLNLVLLQLRSAIALVFASMGVGIFLGVQQLRHQQFVELLSVLQRVTRRRQIVANHVVIRQSSETLRECQDLASMCQILRDALESIGFDTFRFLKSGKNGFSRPSFSPCAICPMDLGCFPGASTK